MKKTEGASARVKKILQLLSLSFLMIALRAWHLSVVQRNERQTNSQNGGPLWKKPTAE
jgi:hypothetical protein